MAYSSKWKTKNGDIVPVGSNLFGTCTAGSSDVVKTVSMPEFNVLTEGVTIHVYFANSNSASAPQLQVGSTQAKPIYCSGGNQGAWNNGSVISFTYINGHWIQNDYDSNGGGGGGTETDPVFTSSPAYGITSADIDSWDAKSDFSGNYNDLINKPTIPTVPTDVSAFNNDAGYIDEETDPTVPSWAKQPTKPTYTASEVGAQPTLVSGVNIKTINGNSLLGSGDLSIGGGGVTPADYITEQGTKAGNHGTWFYRKWVSGMVEAWYNMDTALSVNFNSSSSVAGTYRKDSSITIPTGIFDSTPNFGMVNVQQDSTTIHGEFHPVSTTTGTVFWTRNATGTANITAHIYLMSFPTQ